VENDKAFAAYAFTLVAGIGTLVTVMLSGAGPLPSALALLEHVVLSLMIRASYKSLGGWDWSEWKLVTARPRWVTVKVGPRATPNGAAGAEA
jgi:hypothetical protein